MATRESRTRSYENIEHAVRALAQDLGVDEVVIVGSQAVLVHRPDALRALRNSPKIDAFVVLPSGHGPIGEDASHQINSSFGEGSAFHQTHGFFIDGVDASTATLPSDWRGRAVERQVDLGQGRTATVVAPAMPDLASAKLARGSEKDVVFASLCLATGLTRRKLVADSIESAMDGQVGESPCSPGSCRLPEDRGVGCRLSNTCFMVEGSDIHDGQRRERV